MLELEADIYKLKMEFNKRFLDAREIKRKACEEIRLKHKRLRELNDSLNVQGGHPI